MSALDHIVFRQAIAEDLPAIIMLLADDELGVTREDISFPLAHVYRQAFAAIENDPNQFLAVGADGNRIVSVMQLTFIPGLSHMGAWRGQIEGVRVASGYRGLGLGQHFFAWGLELCRKRGCSAVQLTTNKQRWDARRFYERLGFEATHEGYKLDLKSIT